MPLRRPSDALEAGGDLYMFQRAAPPPIGSALGASLMTAGHVTSRQIMTDGAANAAAATHGKANG